MYIPQSPPNENPPKARNTQKKNKKKNIKYSKCDNFKLHKKQEVTYSVKRDKHKKKNNKLLQISIIKHTLIELRNNTSKKKPTPYRERDNKKK